MAYVTTTRPASTLFADLKDSLLQRLAQHRNYRATVDELSGLSDRELQDLGMFRADIRAIARKTSLRA